MYKKIKITKKYAVAFEKFGKQMKKITNVHKSGIRNWDSEGHYTYSLVIGTFRVMIYKDKNTGYCKE